MNIKNNKINKILNSIPDYAKCDLLLSFFGQNNEVMYISKYGGYVKIRIKMISINTHTQKYVFISENNIGYGVHECEYSNFLISEKIKRLIE